MYRTKVAEFIQKAACILSCKCLSEYKCSESAKWLGLFLHIKYLIWIYNRLYIF